MIFVWFDSGNWRVLVWRLSEFVVLMSSIIKESVILIQKGGKCYRGDGVYEFSVIWLGNSEYLFGAMSEICCSCD